MKKKTTAAKTSKTVTKSKLKTADTVPERDVSSGEWKILTVLWKRGSCIASQVECSLKGTTGWTRGAVRSYLSRLVSYGVVRQLDDERISRFEAVYDRETLFFKEIEALLEKCDADIDELLAVYLANQRQSDETVRRLKRLLAKHATKN